MIHSFLIASLAVSKVATAGVPPAPSFAVTEPAAASYVTARLEVDASALTDGSPIKQSLAELAQDQVEGALGDELATRQVPLVTEDPGVIVRVTLRWKDYEASHYGVKLDVVVDGFEKYSETAECRLCDENQVAVIVVDMVPRWLRYLERESSSTEAATPVFPDGDDGARVTEPTRTSDRARRFGIMGYGGVATAAIGLGASIGGLFVLLEAPSRRLVQIDDTSFEETSRRSLGSALVGTGASLLLAGVALIVVDQTVMNKHRRRNAAALTLRPTATPTALGFVLARRF